MILTYTKAKDQGFLHQNGKTEIFRFLANIKAITILHHKKAVEIILPSGYFCCTSMQSMSEPVPKTKQKEGCSASAAPVGHIGFTRARVAEKTPRGLVDCVGRQDVDDCAS